MPLRPGAPAPYGPPAGVLAVINGYRDRGLATPFTPEVLLRLGISESLIARVLKSLEGLDLIDKDGTPTAQLEGLRRASSDEFPQRLGEVVRAVYADVFQFADPGVDDHARIADAFRAYEPIGQRGRMVTLFLGLCEAAGIIQPSFKKVAASSPGRSANGARKRSPATRMPDAASDARKVAVADPKFSSAGAVPPAIAGLLAALPSSEQGWTQARRNRFLATFAAVVDFSIPIRDDQEEDE